MPFPLQQANSPLSLTLNNRHNENRQIETPPNPIDYKNKVEYDVVGCISVIYNAYPSLGG